jgi:hypothetical protein
MSYLMYISVIRDISHQVLYNGHILGLFTAQLISPMEVPQVPKGAPRRLRPANVNFTAQIRHKASNIQWSGPKGVPNFAIRLWISMPAEGLEPPTNGLQNRCSTTELSRRR